MVIRGTKAALLALGLAGVGVAGVGLAACSNGSENDGGATTSPSTTTAPETVLDDDLKLNEIQAIGTHNSFHRPLPADEFALLEDLNADQAAERTYAHLPIGEQLDTQQIRQLELDIFVDTQGGLYATPALRIRAGGGPLADPAMAEPGTKVLHEQDVDYVSVCPTLVACLTEVATWSDANPDHVPVAINLQFKDGPLIFDVPEQAVPEKWTSEAMDGLDEDIRSVFDPGDLITPDDVRGDAATLEASVLAGGWPTLGESRGKVMFLMINGDPYRSIYLEGHPNLEGRILFTNAEPGQPDASYIGVDDPREAPGRIAELVELGYLVRTRADTPGVEAAADDTTRLEAALASGAHWISTDYPGPDGAAEEWGTEYVAQLPGFLAARCNPVTAPDACEDAAVEP